MGALRTHRDLEVWENNVQLVTVVYIMTEAFPMYELIMLSNQMRRAAASIPSNIAEGAGRLYDNKFVQFCILLPEVWPSWKCS